MFDDYYEEERRRQEEEERIRNIVRHEVNRKRSIKTPWFRIIVLSLVFGILGNVFSRLFLGNENIVETPGENNQTTNEIIIEAPEEDDTIENIVYKKAQPSVVGITTLTQRQGDLFFNPGGYAQGLGSGFIVSSDGYIVTNSHVVSDGAAEEISVLFSNGEELPAVLKFYDRTLDLAIIKVEATGLKPAKLGDSDHIKVGDKAIAVGNPIGLDLYLTQTSGIISGLDRSIQVTQGITMDGLMQTDAAINGGNSGGPLYNNLGEVIGINTAKANAEGIGFSIPINIGKPIVESFLEKGDYKPVTIGIHGMDVALYTRYYNTDLSVDHGIIITDVGAGTPAEAAGLRQGHIIVSVEGEEIKSMSQLKQALVKKQPGDTMTLEVYENNSKKEVELSF